MVTLLLIKGQTGQVLKIVPVLQKLGLPLAIDGNAGRTEAIRTKLVSEFAANNIQTTAKAQDLKVEQVRRVRVAFAAERNRADVGKWNRYPTFLFAHNS